MSVIQILILLLIAAVCGSIGKAIVGYSRGGCLVSIALGFIGAVIGSWIAIKLGLPVIFSVRVGNERFPVIWSIIGSAIFVAFINLLSGGHGRR
ncbi:TPA: hypothetical protein ENG04_00885 [Candidatus Poribacteria bacterium]|nr:hypothetical protein [Candidatus Poribacteria bacterium]HEX28620.1 hypothetical protein [Candidatus Poribacteria bacterium]